MRRKKEPLKISDLIDTESGRMDAIWRTIKVPMGWTFAAFASLGVVVTVATTDQGETRLAELPQAVSTVVARAQTPTHLAENMRQTQQLALMREETRKFSSDRQKLEQRIAELERNVGDFTGSIAPVSSLPRRMESIPNERELSSQPVVEARADVEAPAKPAPKDMKNALPAGQVTVATRTQFGVDLGTDYTLSAVKLRWQRLIERHGGVVSSLEPVVGVRESADGKVSLHLMVGPLADVAEAASLCARLRSSGAACAPGSYDGQRLVLR